MKYFSFILHTATKTHETRMQNAIEASHISINEKSYKRIVIFIIG